MTQHDKLDHWLEDALTDETYLDDDGFTERVMARLPDPAVNPHRVRLLSWAAGLSAATVAAAVFPWSKAAPALTALSVDALLSGAVILGGAFTLAALSAGLYTLNRA
ncbi:DUF5056 domain-containing protein [Gilvimarinus xylanilyticus]|uniref:DUF5056 domain-containing protein n=1 Tax=Gilvimarinus xylanilyticus TaxID=2944139 RepID=A0A9X2I3J4_9GAMM|nr:DUF5056 domain-containing protein [Gilvimarinus xylanilyticus]MCP8899690.1 DUF5056 domain-containing protein [Gilvimarinus xylanilyticus]